MKRLILISTLFLALISCSKSSDDTTTTPVADFIKFKYKNVNYSFVPETVTSGKKLIQGYDLSRRISIWLPKTPAVGTYPLTTKVTDDTSYTASYSENTPQLDFESKNNTSTITITAVTTTSIEGTFSFSSTDSGVNYEITEGSFKAPRGSL